MIVLAPWWRGSSYERFLAAAPPGRHRGSAEHSRPARERWCTNRGARGSSTRCPDLPVFVDSRIEIIPSDVWHDYGQVGFSGAEWKDVLDRWDVQAIVAASDWDLLPVLEATIRIGVRSTSDDDGALFVRA